MHALSHISTPATKNQSGHFDGNSLGRLAMGEKKLMSPIASAENIQITPVESDEEAIQMMPEQSQKQPLDPTSNNLDLGSTITSADPDTIQRVSWNESGCNLTASYDVGCNFMSSDSAGEYWTDAREAQFVRDLKTVIETAFNANIYRISPSATRQDTNALQDILDYLPGVDYACRCQSGGFHPGVEINSRELPITQRAGDWNVTVTANSSGRHIISSSGQTFGQLDEADVNPRSSGQIPAVHEFGHSIGLHHPGRNVTLAPGTDEYSHAGQDEFGRDVEGTVDLMGESMGLRPFYFDDWVERLNDQYPGCNFSIT